jgi:hypothetical protein
VRVRKQYLGEPRKVSICPSRYHDPHAVTLQTKEFLYT